MQVTAYMDGLEVWGTVEYDPGQPQPSYSCAGVPPSWDAEVEGVALDDAAEFLATGIVADLGEHHEWSSGTVRIVEAGIRLTNRLPQTIKRWLLSEWSHELRERLVDECSLR